MGQGRTPVIRLHDTYCTNGHTLGSANGYCDPSRAGKDEPRCNRVPLSAGKFHGRSQLSLSVQAVRGDWIKPSLNDPFECSLLRRSEKDDAAGRMLEWDSASNDRRVHHGVPRGYSFNHHRVEIGTNRQLDVLSDARLNRMQIGQRDFPQPQCSGSSRTDLPEAVSDTVTAVWQALEKVVRHKIGHDPLRRRERNPTPSRNQTQSEKRSIVGECLEN